MLASTDSPSPIPQRHRARRLAFWNGALWAIGNGLASTTLIIYLARELHAERFGLGIGLIAAAPQIVGILRWGTPGLVRRLGNLKTFCVVTFLLSAGLLLMLPWLCAPGRLASPQESLTVLILL